MEVRKREGRWSVLVSYVRIRRPGYNIRDRPHARRAVLQYSLAGERERHGSERRPRPEAEADGLARVTLGPPVAVSLMDRGDSESGTYSHDAPVEEADEHFQGCADAADKAFDKGETR